MALDGLLLHQIDQELQAKLPCRINKIQNISDVELLWTLRSAQQTLRLLISLHSTYNRIHFTKANYTTLESPTNFVMLLRKQLEGGFIRKCEQVGLDRVLHMEVEARDELGDLHRHDLYIELMGKYANLVLVDESGIISDALKRIPIFENSKRLIHPGARYELPKQDETKHDPFTCREQDLDDQRPLSAQLHGTSPLLARELQYRMQKQEPLASVMREISESHTLYLHSSGEKTLFHCIPLTHLGSELTTFPLMEGMDVLFYEKEERVRIKQQSGDIARVIRRELNKDRNKLPKLLQALDEAMDCERYREYGDLLFAYGSQLQKQPTITLPSFEREEEVTIPIDMRFDLRHNANRYYQKYHKQRRAQSILKEQIVLCEEQIRYFEQLEAQLEIASVPDAMEIREELVHQGYMKARKAGIHRRAKGKQAPHFTTFEINGVRVYLGKNNLQNEYLTRTLARKSDLWFHAKGYHGAHVICTDPQPEESLLRTCAMLAAYYSKGRYSSSVPVDYCAIRQLKKVPGSKAGMVTMQSYRTIYIDPDAKAIAALHADHQIRK